VLVSGHGDSWDIAEGAMDDGGGFMASWEVVRTLHVLGLRPKRTIRAVVWVNEENGDAGAVEFIMDIS
jgi:carboxypeptidase Q